MRTVLQRVMNFAYLDGGVPRVVTARVMIQHPLGLQGSALHVMSNIAMQRTNLFFINDEDVEMQNGTLVTDHISWKFNERSITAIPRAKKNPSNYSCICCALADYFERCMQVWLRNRRDAIDFITLDVVVADHEDAQYIEDIKPELGREFFEASVFVLETSSRTWSNMGVLITDKQRFSGNTIFLAEKGRDTVSSSHLQINITGFNPYGGPGDNGSLHNVLSDFTDKFGIFNGLLMIKENTK